MNTSSESESYDRTVRAHRLRGREAHRRSRGRASGSTDGGQAEDISDKISTLASTLKVLHIKNRTVCLSGEIKTVRMLPLLLHGRTPAETCLKWTGCWESTGITQTIKPKRWHWLDHSLSHTIIYKITPHTASQKSGLSCFFCTFDYFLHCTLYTEGLKYMINLSGIMW